MSALRRRRQLRAECRDIGERRKLDAVAGGATCSRRGNVLAHGAEHLQNQTSGSMETGPHGVFQKFVFTTAVVVLHKRFFFFLCAVSRAVRNGPLRRTSAVSG